MGSYNAQDSKSVRNVSVSQSGQKLLTFIDFQKSKTAWKNPHQGSLNHQELLTEMSYRKVMHSFEVLNVVAF